jgi:S-adenosylmethionine synthetase
LEKEIKAICSIGDDIIKYYVSDSTEVNLIKYSEVVKVAKEYIKSIGGFEKLAEWGLIR